MKELSIEEKAKRYDSMFERLKEMYNNNKTNVADRLIYERYFPELKESEDERIRKELICYFEKYPSIVIGPFNTKECIAWLEKQGEQRPYGQREECSDCEFRCGDKCIGSCAMKIGEQKPAWSEEDEERLSDAIFFVREYQIPTRDKRLLNAAKETEDWLRTFQDRVQPKQEWSKEDEKMIENIIDTINMSIEDCDVDDVGTKARFALEKERDWLKNKLKSLRPQNNVTDEELAQAKKDAYNNVLDKIEYDSENPTFDDGWSAAIWYLKKRNAQPQSTWKPSDEQMNALNYVVNLMASSERPTENDLYYNILKSLRQQLMKLKG